MTYFKDRPDRLEKFKAGDREILSEIFALYAPVVAQFVVRGFSDVSGRGRFHFRGVQSPSEQDDIVQETLMRFFAPETRERYDDRSTVRNYLLATARNVVLMRLRNREDPVDSVPDEQPNEAEPSPMEKSVLAEELKTLVGAFEQTLPTKQRDLFRRHFIDGHSLRTIAADTGASLMKVRYALSIQKRRLRSFLQARGYGCD